MSGESDILLDLLDQVDRSATGAREALELIVSLPATPADLADAPPLVRVASRAFLKSFEQLEDSQYRLMRTLMRIVGYRLKGLTPLDISNKAEELGWVADARAWFTLHQLRNDLVHEYPDDEALRFERLCRAIQGVQLLLDARDQLRAYVDARRDDLLL